MRQVLLLVAVAALLTTACGRQGLLPKPTVAALALEWMWVR